MLSVKAIYKEGKFIPEDSSFPKGDNKHVIIIFPDDDAKEENIKCRKNFIKKWQGALPEVELEISKEQTERKDFLRKKYQ